MKNKEYEIQITEYGLRDREYRIQKTGYRIHYIEKWLKSKENRIQNQELKKTWT